MSDKFMCLCFPEFSGKYMYTIRCVFIHFFCSLLVIIGDRREKSYSNVPLSHFLSFYRSRPRPLSFILKPLALIALVSKPPLKLRMLSTDDR